MLADQLIVQAVAQGRRVVRCKFDDAHQETPYHGLLGLFDITPNRGGLTAPGLIKPGIESNRDASILARAFPSLQHIFGVQVSTSNEPVPTDTHLIRKLMAKLIAELAGNSHGLAIFFDDLQWIDVASAEVIFGLLDAAIPGTMFVGAWRTDLEQEHDAVIELNAFSRRFPGIEVLEPEAFDQALVKQRLVDSLGRRSPRINELAKLFHDKSGGYPHFVGTMLLETARDGSARYDTSLKCWVADIEQLKHYPPTNGVGDILSRQLQGLDAEFLSNIKLAACFGRKVSGQMFSDLAVLSNSGVKSFIDRAVTEGLLSSERNVFSFPHDRVHQVVYRSMNDHERTRWHERIAVLMANYSDRDLIDRSFDIANQYRMLPSFELRSPEERKKIARIFFRAGKQAHSSFAFVSALDYLTRGIEMLSDQSWYKEPTLKSELFLPAADSAYLCGDHQRATTLLSVLVSESTVPSNKANAYRVQMKVAIAQNRPEQAIDFAHLGLREIGYDTPRHVSKLRAYATLRLLLFSLRNFDGHERQFVGSKKSPVARDATLILANLINAASQSGNVDIAIYVSGMLRISLKNNEVAEAACALCFFAVAVKTFFGDIDEAYRLGKIAISMSDDSKYLLINATLTDGLINCWKEPLRTTSVRLTVAYRRGIDTDDVEVAITVGLHAASRLFFIGDPLSNVKMLFAEISADAKRLNQTTLVSIEAVYCQAIENLQTGRANPWVLTGDVFDENSVVGLTANAKAHFYIIKAYLALLFKAYDRSEEYIAQAGPNLPAVSGQPITYTYYFVECLLLVRSSLDQKRPHRQLSKLRAAAIHAPMNFYHQVLLIEAMLANDAGQISQARTSFDEAIEITEQQNNFCDLGLICEHALEIYRACNDDIMVEKMQRTAKTAYSRWGLASKVEQLLHLDSITPKVAL